MQMQNQSNISELVKLSLSKKIILKKGLNAKIWNLNEYEYTGTVNKDDRFDGYGILKYLDKSTDIIKYQGDFINGLKNGNGKETYQNDDIYIGNFKNGMKNGNGKLYSKDGTIKYSGLWSNNEATNDMVYYEYDENNRKKYYGSFRNGRYHGLGVIFNKNENITSIGEYNDGHLIKVLEFNINPVIKEMYICRMTEDISKSVDIIFDAIREPFDMNKLEKIRYYMIDESYNGNIIIRNEFNEIYYTGQIKDNNFNGKGEYKIIDNHVVKFIFEGVFENNKFINGIIKSNTGSINNSDESLSNISQMYIGTYKDGIIVNQNLTLYDILKKLDEGIYNYSDINTNKYRCDGKFNDGKFSNGTMYLNNIKVYEGSFADFNVYHGYGKEYYSSGIMKYEGGFRNGKYNGQGTIYYENGNLEYYGSYLFGDRHGHGILYLDDGTLVYEGNFRHNNID